MAEVTVLSTGGTIASTSGESGATPQKRGEELLDAVPGLDDVADLRVEQVVQIPSFDMDLATMLQIRDRIHELAGETDGVVITHGTDTMEETAYVLDATLSSDVPVVLTGAQRRPDEVSPDGPANLSTAVRAAVHDRLSGRGGAYIAFNEQLHAARDVTKTHTSRLETFSSLDAGPVAAFDHAGVRFLREPGSRTTAIDVDSSDATVAMVKSGAGVGGRQIRSAVSAGADGLVLEGTGLGNVTTAMGEAVEEAVEAGVTVVVASRCHAGRVAPVYGGGGGGATLAEYGVLSGGDLPAHKARLKLRLALAADGDADEYF